MFLAMHIKELEKTAYIMHLTLCEQLMRMGNRAEMQAVLPEVAPDFRTVL